MNLRTKTKTRQENKLTIDSTNNGTVLQRLNYLQEILTKIKRKSAGIRLICERVKSIKEKRQQKKEIILPMIKLLAGLDYSYTRPGKRDKKNREEIGKAITLCLEIIKQMGGKLLRAEKGDIFDSKIHRVVSMEECDLPDKNILEVVYRGFQVGETIYPAHVIVAKNTEKSNKKESEFVNEQKQVMREKTKEKSREKLKILSHQEYRKYVKDSFARMAGDPFTIKWIKKYHQRLLSVFKLDFDPIIKKIRALYSSDKRGNGPKDPIALIRSMLLMSEFKETSIPSWVAQMQTTPLLAIVAGLEPGNTAAVGTYYKFFERLENGPYRPKCPPRILASERRRARLPYHLPKEKPKEKVKKNEPPEKDVLKKLVLKLKKEENEPIPNDLERILNEILLEVAVKPSAAKKLLGEIDKLTACADGSTIPSGANHNGKRTCDCKKKGIFRCEHLRKQSDIDAAWGWDNRKKDWIFGYRYYQLVSPEKKHNLPLYLCMGPANTHEAVMSLITLERFRKQNEKFFPGLKIKRFSGDAIHDAYAFYHYLCGRKILYAIPYSNAPANCLDLHGNGQLFNQKGTPLCPAGCLMRRITRSRHGDLVYGCPVKRPTNRKEGRNIRLIHRDECPREALCEPDSKWGPYVRFKPEDDPRVHPAIPRESEEYRKLRDLRSSTERSNSMKKERFLLKSTNTRVLPYAFIRAALISIIEHSKVWVQEKLEDFEVTNENVLDLFD